MDYTDRLAQIFKRDDIRGVYPMPLDASLAFDAALSFAASLAEQGMPRVAIGYDARLSSPELAIAAARGVTAADGVPDLLGLCSSEQLYFACGRYPERYAGGIMVTASHNPAEYNGMKFVLAGGAPLSADGLDELHKSMLKRHLHDAECFTASSSLGEDFAEHLLTLGGWEDAGDYVAASRMKVVVSAGNGVGAVAFAPLARRLAAFGFDFIMMEEEPDGGFPNGVPNPLLPDFMGRLAKRVRAEGAAMGIGFDGDADRAGFADETGRVLSPAEVYVSVARYKLKHADVMRPVLMRNLCCSQFVVDAFRNDAVDVVDTPVGHGQIKRLMRCKEFNGRVVFAGEHSGHYFYPEFYSADSGMMTSLIMLHVLREDAIAAAKSLSMLFDIPRKNYCWSGEINAQLPNCEAVMTALTETWQRTRERFGGAVRREVRVDGSTGLNRVFAAAPDDEYKPAQLSCPDLKVNLDDGDGSGWWFVLRPSGNEPKLRLNVEAYGTDCAAVCRELAQWLQTMF